MRLLMKRSIRENKLAAGRSDFVLWARFELTDEERILVQKYFVLAGYLTIEGSWQDFRRACLYAIIPALICSYIIGKIGDISFFTMPLIIIFFFFGIAYLIYEQIREAIKITDIVNGREFKNKSLILLMRRERRMVGYAVAFKNMLEAMQTWEGTEVIELSEEHEGALRLVTDTYAPA